MPEFYNWVQDRIILIPSRTQSCVDMSIQAVWLAFYHK